jgi:hypothetical protein
VGDLQAHAAFKNLLDYMYSGGTAIISRQHALEVYELANKYQILEARAA